jgi:hypothetical protein
MLTEARGLRRPPPHDTVGGLDSHIVIQVQAYEIKRAMAAPSQSLKYVFICSITQNVATHTTKMFIQHQLAIAGINLRVTEH